MEAHWLTEGRQKDDWTTAVMSAMSLTTWESGNYAKNKPAVKQPGKPAGLAYSNILFLQKDSF